MLAFTIICSTFILSQVKGQGGKVLPYDKDGNPLKPDGTPLPIGNNGQIIPLNPDGSVKVYTQTIPYKIHVCILD